MTLVSRAVCRFLFSHPLGAVSIGIDVFGLVRILGRTCAAWPMPAAVIRSAPVFELRSWR